MSEFDERPAGPAGPGEVGEPGDVGEVGGELPELPEVPAAVLESAEAALAGEPEADRVLLLDRVRRYWPDLLRGLELAYGARAHDAAAAAVGTAVARFAERSPDLRLLDLRRLAAPDWFQHPRMLGYACYAERFGGTLAGVAAHVDYLAELGVTYLHLMPLLEPRPAPNDGGYAVRDYRKVRPDLGRMVDLADLARVLRAHDISLTLDLVLNHVAREHDWAERARSGDRRYRDYFHVFDDRAHPDEFERSLPEVFPDLAPDNFTWDDDLDGWVWTTFNSWQWDLNWHNPEVFGEFADLILYLANQGVECLRLDAIAFLWKRVGTTCQNQPEVHALTQALHAVTRIAAPAMVFKAEAIVGPGDLPSYLGTGEHAGKVSDMAYHNGLMVHVWSSLAAADARLARVALRRLPAVPRTTAWVTYVRCHDDIGWAIDDADAAAVGWDGAAHRAFLSDWYSGSFPLSDARGLVFGENPDTGDRRISGTSASLAGLEAALDAGDEDWVRIAMRRHLLAHLAVLGFGGMPVLYMGDELALRNDYGYRIDPARADDNRWVHRPAMPWAYAERRRLAGSLEHLAWSTVRHAAAVRSRLIGMHASVPADVLDGANPAVLAWARRHPRQTVVVLNNVSARVQRWPLAAVPVGGGLVDALTGKPARVQGYDVELEPYEAVWLLRGS
jgi:amylosucrase